MPAEADNIAQVLAGHTPQVLALVDSLRQLIRAAGPELVEEGKPGWRNITYKKTGVICAISPHKVYVNLHFYQGTRLPDPAGLLEGGGKALRHVKIRRPEDIRVAALTGLVQAALRLDDPTWQAGDRPEKPRPMNCPWPPQSELATRGGRAWPKRIV